MGSSAIIPYSKIMTMNKSEGRIWENLAKEICGYDAWCCVSCNEWLDEACFDPNCPFDSRRRLRKKYIICRIQKLAVQVEKIGDAKTISTKQIPVF